MNPKADVHQVRIQAASSHCKGRSHDVVTEQPVLLANGRGWRGEGRVGLKGGDNCDCGKCVCGNYVCWKCNCCGCTSYYWNCDNACSCLTRPCSKCISGCCAQVIIGICGEIVDQVIKALEACCQCCGCCLDLCGNSCNGVFRGSNTAPGLEKRYSPVPSPCLEAEDCHDHDTQAECGELYI